MSAIDDLTNAQLRIVDLAIRGMNTKEIARVLGISHRTVEVQKANARHRLEVATWLQVVLMIDRENRGAPAVPVIVAAAWPERATAATVSEMEPA